MTTAIDTLEAANLLRKAGFKQEQAEAMIKALAPGSYGFITKEYLDTQLDTVRAEIKNNTLLLKGEIKDLENRLIKWIVVLQITSVATLVGVIVALLNIK